MMARRKPRTQLDDLSIGFLESHPATAADVLERLSVVDAVTVLLAVPARIGTAVIAEMLPLHAAQCLLTCPTEHQIGLLHNQTVQNIAAILRHYDKEQRHLVLTQLPTATSVTCRMLLRHPENSVGAIVDSNALALAPTTKVKEALLHVREARQGNADYVYVIDAQRNIIGLVTLTELLRTNQQHTLEALIHTAVPKLSVQASLSAAYAHPGWIDFHTLPVVEQDQRFVGTLHYADLNHHLQKLTAEKPAPEDSHVNMAMLSNAYWQLFDTLLQSVVHALPTAQQKHHPDSNS